MKRFDAMVQEVVMLNRQLVALGGHPGDETRMLIQERLWAIIGDLDQRLFLQLDNHCLGLTVESGRLRIHFWTGRGSPPESETNIYIADNFLVERHVTVLRTGQTPIYEPSNCLERPCHFFYEKDGQ